MAITTLTSYTICPIEMKSSILWNLSCLSVSTTIIISFPIPVLEEFDFCTRPYSKGKMSENPHKKKKSGGGPKQ